LHAGGGANFDYIGSADPWISAATYYQVERFCFYQKYADGRPHHPLAQSMQIVARWRVNHDFYHFPWSAARPNGCAPARACAEWAISGVPLP
jgi:hypothetical protein